jgi:hypothetical protein
MKNYTARWAQTGRPTIGNVSFEAQSDYHAKLRANKIAKEISCTNTPRTITCEGKLIECIQTGISS